MKRSIPFLLLLAACATKLAPNPAPVSTLYFPTGLVHADLAGSSEGVLFVVSSNADKRFDTGALTAIDLGALVGDGGLPPFGAPVAASPVQVTQLGATQSVYLSSFGGELAAAPLINNSGVRLFVPSRSEGQKFQAVDAFWVDGGVSMQCATPPSTESGVADCGAQAPSLVGNWQTTSGLPAAPSPSGVAVSGCVGAGSTALACPVDVFVTHMLQADSPHNSNLLLQGYVVRIDGETPTVSDGNFIALGPGATSSVVTGARWAYAAGRQFATTTLPTSYLIRMVDHDGNVFNAGLETELRVLDARGIALSADETRLYLAGRLPDSLAVVSVSNPLGAPVLDVMRSVPLPEGPNLVRTVPRPGRSDLVLVSCSTAGVLAIYDDDVGDLVAQVPGIGNQPWAIAVDQRGAGARVYVSNFLDGRVAVIDIADLSRPQGAALVAHLGATQCSTRGIQDGTCDGGTP